MRVRIAVVVMLANGVAVSLGGGGGDVAPGHSICPAKTEIARVRLRIVTAHTWRKVFMFDASHKRYKNFAS